MSNQSFLYCPATMLLVFKWFGRFLHSLRSVEMTVNDSCLSVEMTVNDSCLSVEMTVNDSCLSVEMTVSQTIEAEGCPLSGSPLYIVPV